MERSFERQIVPAPVVSTLVGQRLRPLVSAERTEDVEDNAGYSWPSLMVGSEGNSRHHHLGAGPARGASRRARRFPLRRRRAGRGDGACDHAPATRPVAGGRGRLLRRGRHARRARARRRATPASATRTVAPASAPEPVSVLHRPREPLKRERARSRLRRVEIPSRFDAGDDGGGGDPTWRSTGGAGPDNPSQASEEELQR